MFGVFSLRCSIHSRIIQCLLCMLGIFFVISLVFDFQDDFTVDICTMYMCRMCVAPPSRSAIDLVSFLPASSSSVWFQSFVFHSVHWHTYIRLPFVCFSVLSPSLMMINYYWFCVCKHANDWKCPMKFFLSFSISSFLFELRCVCDEIFRFAARHAFVTIQN